eukprot:gnl/TRDRNA2_/TRDRNA2_140511_c1_seq2.p1 gnl/TRDRNA2_/TRDRNA2_140511_c1~~gnl/TRDRNA2_/TRDRNA2_140511_c1_seq2.p1  ORF type:complete len:159 (+),score=11.95 gnl/TRDRNA2_/TRDRNA2_140511_c1_seq2:2-478(+)
MRTVDISNSSPMEMQMDPASHLPVVGDSLSTSSGSERSDISQASEPDRSSREMPLAVHYILTFSFVSLSVTVAIFVPSASDLMSIVGGFACVTYVFVLPARMATKLRSEPTNRLASSPAAFLLTSWAWPVIASLYVCSALGYIAAAQSMVAIVHGKSR